MCGLSSDGRISCWGHAEMFADDGLNGYITDAPSGTVSSYGYEWVAVSGGYAHNCAIDSAGNIECWGDYRVVDAVP